MSKKLSAKTIQDFLEEKSDFKVILFTKKADTPMLWVKLVESCPFNFIFGEVRDHDQELMMRFEISPESLPKIIAFRNLVSSSNLVFYDGPIDFCAIQEFLKNLNEFPNTINEYPHTFVHEDKVLDSSNEVEVQKSPIEICDLISSDNTIEELIGLNRGLKIRNEELEEIVRTFKADCADTVSALCSENFDSFLISSKRPLKAVLFSTKSDIPFLWQHLAHNHSMTVSFGFVKHVEHGILLRYKLRTESLPRIYLFGNGSDNPIPYDGPVNTESISTFLKDAVEGGPACVEMRRLLHVALKEMDTLRSELVQAKQSSELASSEVISNLREENNFLRKELEQSRLESVQAERDSRINLSKLEVQMRATFQAQKAEALSRKDREIAEERRLWSEVNHWAASLDLTLEGIEIDLKQIEKTLLKATSTLHVRIVRWVREKEKLQHSLQDFIKDVAPVQMSNKDDRTLSENDALETDRNRILQGFHLLRKSLKAAFSDVQNRDNGNNEKQETPMSPKDYMSAYQSHIAKMGKAPNEVFEDSTSARPKGRCEKRFRQGEEPVLIRGYSGITIGQLTREVTKAKERNLFFWRDRRLRLIYDGNLRDRLIDECSGDTIYTYSREKEQEKLRRRNVHSRCRSEDESCASEFTRESTDHDIAKTDAEAVMKRMPSLVNGVVVMSIVPGKKLGRWSPCSESDDEPVKLCCLEDAQTCGHPLHHSQHVKPGSADVDSEVMSSTSLFNFFYEGEP